MGKGEDWILRRYAKASPHLKKTADAPLKALIIGGRKTRKWLGGCRPAAEEWLHRKRR